jgi:hypothetical protein
MLRPLPRILVFLALAVALAAPATASAHVGDAVTLEGTLEFTHSDNFQKKQAHYYYSLRQGKKVTRLDFGRWRKDLRNGMKLRVRGRLADGGLAVEKLKTLHRSPIRALAAATPGPRRVAVLLFNFTNDRSQPWTTAGAAATMFTGAGSVASYFQEESFGSTTMTGDVFGWSQLPTSSAGCAIDSWAAAANQMATAAGVNLSSYQHVVYVFPYVMDCGWAGLAEMPGSHVWINGNFVLRTLAHELSHNLGVHHAASLSCNNGTVKVALSSTCSYSEYGDPFDVMGQGGRHTSAWHKGQIGWLDPLGQQTVTASGTYTISPQEWAAGGVQSLRVQRGSTSNYLYLEYRRPYGSVFDNFSVSDPVVNGVTIRMAPDYKVINLSYLIDTTPTTPTFIDSALGNGQTFTDSANSITIKTVGVSASGATVQITLPGGGSSTPPPPPPPTPPADTTPPTAPGTLSAQVNSGPYVSLSWSPASDNVGIDGYRVYRDGTQLFQTIGLYYTDPSPVAGTTPTYTVRAVDAAGNLGPSSNGATVSIPSSGGTPPPPPPPPVTPPPPPTSTGGPSNTAVPTLSGSATVGSTLTASLGTWSGATPMTFSYRWQRCTSTGYCMNIYGVIGNTFRPTSAYIGYRIVVVVTAVNAIGTSQATSAATAAVKYSSGSAASTAAAPRDLWDANWATVFAQVIDVLSRK